MRREGRGREDQNDQMKFEEFLPKAIIYWALGKAVGLKGTASTACAFLGPIGENIFKVPLLESLGQAIERQERQKKLDELKLKFNQDLESLFPVSAKNHSIESGELISPLGTLSDKNPTIVTPIDSVQKIEKHDIWSDVIKSPAIIVIFGGRGSGKTATGYDIVEDFRYRLKPYVVGFPEHSKGLLPGWMGIEQRLEDVPSGSISLVDEAYLWHHARDWRKADNRDICRLLNLSRQLNKTIVFIAQLGRQLDIDIVSSADVLILKSLGMLQPKLDRPELRDIMNEARQAFQAVQGDIRRWSYIYSQNANFTGLLGNDLPTFWSPKLSNVYANMGEIALPKPASTMTPEEKMQKAKALYHSGWPQSKIAKYFGVASKGTIFNWINDYPYRK